MKQIQYNKLVRDRIPEIIEASGKTCVTEILSDEAYLKMVDAKLDKELAEYHKDQNIEELADLLEVVHAATIARGYTLEQLEQVRAEKTAKRGGFTRKLLLKAVADPTAPDTLAATIYQNRTAIFAKIDAKMLSTYYWLMENLHTRNVSTDQEYRKRFGGYYVMRFVSQEYRDAFFSLFEQIKNQPSISFEEVSRKLFEVDGKHEFSFISKMLHTINPERPIYDSQVDAALKIRRTYQSDFNKKLQQDTKILNDIAACYQDLASAPEMAEILAAFDPIIPSHKMSVEKKLDFILWAFGGSM